MDDNDRMKEDLIEMKTSRKIENGLTLNAVRYLLVHAAQHFILVCKGSFGSPCVNYVLR